LTEGKTASTWVRSFRTPREPPRKIGGVEPCEKGGLRTSLGGPVHREDQGKKSASLPGRCNTLAVRTFLLGPAGLWWAKEGKEKEKSQGCCRSLLGSDRVGRHDGLSKRSGKRAQKTGENGRGYESLSRDPNSRREGEPPRVGIQSLINTRIRYILDHRG